MAYADVITAHASLEAYYRMGEASGQPQDSSGNGNHTTTTAGSPSYDQTGAIRSGEDDGAILLGGAAAFTAPDSATLDLGDVFTLEAWVKRNSLTAAVNNIMDKGSNAYSFGINAAHQFDLTKQDIAVIVVSTVTIQNTVGWNHLVATKDGAQVNLYVNGGNCTGTVTNQTCANNALILHIGESYLATQRVNMVIDEVAIYSTALTAADVLAHYEAGRPEITGLGAVGQPPRRALIFARGRGVLVG